MNKKSALGQAVAAEYSNLISFVPEKGPNVINKHKSSDEKDASKISGEEAKTFYENLLTENFEDRSNEPARSRRKRKASHGEKSRVEQHVSNGNDLERGDKSMSKVNDQEKGSDSVNCRQNVNNLLYYSQTGDVKMLKKLFKTCPLIDINHQDRFGWTGLMCAVVSGHTDTVDFLLQKGANKLIHNSQNQTASDLAVAAGFHTLKDQLELYGKTRGKKTVKKADPFFCEKCNSTFKESSVKEHQTSTLHLFNMNLKPKINPFMIPRTNIGYRLMKRSGWDGEKGLGPEGKGQKLPVKTVLKRDRTGIGSKSVKQEKKVTHFGPYDCNATVSVASGSRRVMSAAAVSRRERRRKERREKEWERNLRQSMDF